MRSTLSSTLNFLRLIMIISIAVGPRSSHCMEAANEESAERELKWDFAKVSHLMRASAQDLQVKGAGNNAKTVENKAKLQEAFLSIFDALKTDDTITTIDMHKLEAFCETIGKLKDNPTEDVSSTDKKLATLKATPPQKLFIRGLPYKKMKHKPLLPKNCVACQVPFLLMKKVL